MTKRWMVAAMAVSTMCARAEGGAPVRLMTLDPGHFHAALVQKFMYPQVDPAVNVYAPAGDDLQQHLARIERFNTRTNDPTAWKQKVYTGDDFFEKMIAEKPGNVVVLSGNNGKKADYILKSVQNGLNVLADKPMAIRPDDLPKLKQAFAVAQEKGVLLYDIMTERSEITTALQRSLSQAKGLFGELEKGSLQEPAISKESVHHYSKLVAGVPLKRPAWFFDVKQQGEGIVDVTTHLVDLIQWEAFPEQTLSADDVKVLAARRWSTSLTPAQFEKVTALKDYPDFLRGEVAPDGNLKVFANGEFTYTLRGVHAKVSVIWNFEAPEGAKDTHFSVMRGTKAAIVIRQGAEQAYKPTVYVEKRDDRSDADFEAALKAALEGIAGEFPGVGFERSGANWVLKIPAKYEVGHEAHFAEVTERYLKFLAAGRLPAWEVPNMIVKYETIMKAYALSRDSK